MKESIASSPVTVESLFLVVGHAEGEPPCARVVQAPTGEMAASTFEQDLIDGLLADGVERDVWIDEVTSLSFALSNKLTYQLPVHDHSYTAPCNSSTAHAAV